MSAVKETRLDGFKMKARGKVRDIYDLDDRLLLVATDRISAFDVILPQAIPDKGKVLHQIALFWFDWARDIIPNHMVAGSVNDFPDELRAHRDVLAGRSALVKKADMFPVECVARGYIVGSGWKDYQRTGSVCGVDLPQGLQLCDKLPEPIFTPATKAESGHDENISFEQMKELVDPSIAGKLKDLTLELYTKAAAYAEERGIIIADTKFEFGLIDGEIAICDEMLTPDSSRFWPKDEYQPGRNQPSFDKQYVRDFLEKTDWDKNPPPPDLPPEVVEGTRRRYIEALEKLTGHGLTE